VCQNARHRTRPLSEQLNWKKVSTAICTKIVCTHTTFPARKGFLATSSFHKNIFSCLQKCAKNHWINLTQDRDRWQVLGNVVMNKWVQLIEGNCWTICGPCSFSGRTLLYGISQWPLTIHLCRHNLQ